MSAETTPTSVTSAMSRPLATRLVPTRTSVRPAGEVVEDAVRGALALDDVPVETADAQPREPLADLPLHALRPAAQVADPRRRRTTGSGWRWARPARSGGSAAWSRPGDTRAGGRSPGRPARCRSPGTATTDAVPRRLRTRIARSPPAVSRSASASASASESTLRFPAASSARMSTAVTPGLRARRPHRQHRAPVPARPGVAHRLHRGRRRPEHHRRPGQPAQLHRRVACLEARRPVALVGRVVLLVHDDQPDVRERREQGRPRPDHEVDVAAPGSGATRRRARPRPARSAGRRSRTGSSARSRSTIGVASAISGTSSRPAARRRARRRSPRRRSRSCRRR